MNLFKWIKSSDEQKEIIKFNFSNPWYLITALALLKLIIHFLTSTNYGLQRDAYLYIAEAHHLSFGYISIPPLTPVLIRVMELIFGDSVFAVRILPALIGAVSIVVIAKIVLEFGGKHWAILLACVSFLMSPAFLRSNSLLQPVSINQFFWLISLYVVIKMVKYRKTEYWAYLGIIWGLAFLNKYSIVFLAFAVFLGLLVSKRRYLIQSPNLFIGFGFGLLIISPNLVWQHMHNWPVITHMVELTNNQLVNVNIVDFLTMQLFMNANALLIWFFGFLFLLFSKEEKSYRVLGFTYIFLLLILIGLKGKFYYTLGIYTMLFAAGGYFFEKHLKGGWSVINKILLVLIIISAFPILPYSLPVLSYDSLAAYCGVTASKGFVGPLRWEDGQIHAIPQDYADMTGWTELAGIVRNTYNSLTDEEKNRTAIFTGNYGQAGAIRYHTKNDGLPEPISFNDNFILWAPSNVDIDVLIYVNYDTTDVSNYFGEIKKVGQITDQYAIESGLPVFLCKQPQNDFSLFYRTKLHEIRSKYTD
ncbi:MAG: glycosyltransferase family 39 protein [Calditrichaceae bacterium]